MNNQKELEKYYNGLGYKDLGCVNTNNNAAVACQNSKNKQWHEIARNLHLVALHDLKVFVTIDSGD